jgi:sRNA-binding carbon storage regulator CsrA
MLVLRRRLHEAVVFDGGLSLSLVSLEGRRAWLRFEGPGLAASVTVATYTETPDTARLAVADPASVSRSGDEVAVSVSTSEDGEPPGPVVLVVDRRPGQRVRIGELALTLSSVDAGRPVWAVGLPTFAGGVSLTVFSTSTVDARLGIDAPSDVRVYRQEVWLELQSANQGAAGWTAEELAALAPAEHPTTG